MKNKANMVVGAVVAVVVVAAIAVFALLQTMPVGGDGGTLELPLSENVEQTVTTSLGTNVVVVEGGSVYVRDADCDNHDCVRQGKVSSPGRQIICLPHKLWIEIVADGQAGGEMDESAVADGAQGSGGSEDLDAIAR